LASGARFLLRFWLNAGKHRRLGGSCGHNERGDGLMFHARVSYAGIYDMLSEGDSRHVRTGPRKYYA